MQTLYLPPPKVSTSPTAYRFIPKIQKKCKKVKVVYRGASLSTSQEFIPGVGWIERLDQSEKGCNRSVSTL